MRNLWIIARREYLERIRTKAFIFTTILIPALMGGSLLVPQLLILRGGASKHLVVVTSDRHTAEVIGQELNNAKEEEAQRKLGSQPQGELPKRKPRFRI